METAFRQLIDVTFSFDICFGCVIDSYCSLFNYHLGIIIIAFAATCVSIIFLVAKKISFYRILIIGENI